MTELKRKMCKYSKDDFKENKELFVENALNAKFICKQCLRTAEKKDLICDPKKLK